VRLQREGAALKTEHDRLKAIIARKDREIEAQERVTQTAPPSLLRTQATETGGVDGDDGGEDDVGAAECKAGPVAEPIRRVSRAMAKVEGGLYHALPQLSGQVRDTRKKQVRVAIGLMRRKSTRKKSRVRQ